jgi:hypothetical protein
VYWFIIRKAVSVKQSRAQEYWRLQRKQALIGLPFSGVEKRLDFYLLQIMAAPSSFSRSPSPSQPTPLHLLALPATHGNSTCF